jgi:hypothetical protein
MGRESVFARRLGRWMGDGVLHLIASVSLGLRGRRPLSELSHLLCGLFSFKRLLRARKLRAAFFRLRIFCHCKVISRVLTLRV